MSIHNKKLYLIEQLIGYTFHNKTLLTLALTPPSAGLPQDNQRLEFLGDSVLHLCISSLIYMEHSKWSEGELSKLRGMLVCTDSLYQWAKDLDLTLITGPRSPKNTEKSKMSNTLVDALEAIIAAIFLDAQFNNKNAFDIVQKVISQRFSNVIKNAFIGIWKKQDSKTTLQERAAAINMPPPSYKLLQKTGPDHNPIFTVQASLSNHIAISQAGTLKKAQIEAARILLNKLNWI